MWIGMSITVVPIIKTFLNQVICVTKVDKGQEMAAASPPRQTDLQQFCCFENAIKITSSMKGYLRTARQDIPEGDKYYIFAMNETNINSGKMYIQKEYTNT
uniref:Uncharacterized protein n=1 Tax=Leersia perrieri TaxID=77586 RepID=A0A0D9VPE5_9ORYZ